MGASLPEGAAGGAVGGLLAGTLGADAESLACGMCSVGVAALALGGPHAESLGEGVDPACCACVATDAGALGGGGWSLSDIMRGMVSVPLPGEELLAAVWTDVALGFLITLVSLGVFSAGVASGVSAKRRLIEGLGGGPSSELAVVLRENTAGETDLR